MKRIGLIVNPIAGMGGSVGLKGTDGGDILEKALNMGAIPLSSEKCLRALNRLKNMAGDVEVLTCSGGMGERIVEKAGLNGRVVCDVPAVTSRSDTIRCAAKMKDEVSLLMFVGGDGTARDICQAVGESIVVIGVPAGVKMYSACFAINPEAAGDLAAMYLNSTISETSMAEVLDVDEEMFRRGILSTKLYCYLKVPSENTYIQNSKIPTPLDEASSQEVIAEQVVEMMQEGHCYIIGPGTTPKSIMKKFGLESNVLGVDVVCMKEGAKVECIGCDLNEKDILKSISHLDRDKVHLVVTPLGGQGFIFGRGNQQLSPDVLEKLKKENIVIVATPEKIRSLKSKQLFIDTGSSEIDRELEGYYRIVTGYHMFYLMKATSHPVDA